MAVGVNEESLFDQLSLLDELESVREEMDELGLRTLAEAAALTGAPAAELVERMRALAVTHRSELEARIVALHRTLDSGA